MDIGRRSTCWALGGVGGGRGAPGGGAVREPLLDSLRERGVEVVQGACVLEAVADPASGTVAAARVCRLATDGEPDLTSARRIECDGLLMSVGWAPAGNLLYQAGTTMRYDDGIQQF